MKILLRKDIKRYKESLKVKIDPITKLKIDKPVLDHDHKEGFIRGVLDNRTNQFLGKVESAYKRFLGYQKDIPELENIIYNTIYYLSNLHHFGELIHPGYIEIEIKRFGRLTRQHEIDILSNLMSNQEWENKDITKLNKKELTKLYKKLIMRDVYEF